MKSNTFLAIWFSVFAIGAAFAAEAPVQTTTTVAEDESIDQSLKALRPPVLQPLVPAPRGVPEKPLYKEEPPMAGKDFRPPPPIPEPARVERQPRPEEDAGDNPPPPPPCTPNSPNWPNC